MGIVDEDIVRVREAADIVELVSQYTQLKRVGRRFTGLCPFHSEKTGSFSVNAEEGWYHCFGCQVGGDAITFVREKEQLDFVAAVEYLAAKTGIQLRYTDANEGESRKRRSRLHDAIGAAVDFYHERLLSAPDAGPARSYLRERGFDGETVRRFRIGYAPGDWDTLARSLRLSDAELRDTGLGFVNRRGRQQDAFRDRVMFPIFDAQDRAVGFGGRVLPGSSDPAKYKNSTETPIYSKSRVLYGLNWAKTNIVEVDEVIVCEGYTDVIGFFRSGAPRAVATCGTALTEDHVKLLRKFARRVVLAFDADAAGQNAAARFYAWERTHDLDVAVADLPDGVDPGDLAQRDPEALAASVRDAKPFLRFRVDRVLAAGDYSTNEHRARVAGDAIAAVAEHPDPATRDAYALDIATRCRLDDDLVRRMLAQRVGGRGRRVAVAPPVAPRPERRSGPEIEALRLAVWERDEAARLLVADLFDDDVNAEAYLALVGAASARAAMEGTRPEVAALIEQVVADDTESEALDVAARLWQRYLDRRILECRRAARSATTPDDLRDLNHQMGWFKSMAAELPETDTRAAAVDELLAWFHGALVTE